MHAAYKTEHEVDLKSNLRLAATVHPGDRGDPESSLETLAEADETLRAIGSEAQIEEAAMDKGYHSASLLADAGPLLPLGYMPVDGADHVERLGHVQHRRHGPKLPQSDFLGFGGGGLLGGSMP